MYWNVDAYQKKVFEQLPLTLHGSEHVLDLGCGDGHDADWLARTARQTVGVDLVGRSEWERFARPGLTFVEANAEALPFADRSFDVVFLKDVLHHAVMPVRVLSEARRVCASGGRICIVEGNRYNPMLYLHMTLLLGHQHFPRAVFRQMIVGTFPNAQFIQFEAHVYPLRHRFLIHLARLAEEFVARTPMIRRFTAYNAAIVRV